MKNKTLHVYQIILLSCLIVLSTFILIPVQSWVQNRIEGVRDRIIAELQNNNNIQVRYESISASIISVIFIRQLEVHLPEGEFVAENIRLHYNPLRYFRLGKDVWRWVSSLNVSNGHLKLRFQGNSDLDELSIDPWAFIDGKMLRLSFFFVDMEWENGMGIKTGDINATIRDDIRDVTQYEFSTVLMARNIGNSEKIPYLKSGISSSGRFSSTQASVNGQVRFEEMEVGEYRLKPVIADFTYLNNELVVRRLEDEEPVDISFYYSNDSWLLEGKSENLILGRLITSGDNVEKKPDWLNSSLTSVFSFSGDFEDINHDVFVEYVAPRYLPLEDVRLTGAFKGNNRISHVENLELSSGDSFIAYRGEVDISTFLPTGELVISSPSSLPDASISGRFEFVQNNQDMVMVHPVHDGTVESQFDDFRLVLIREEEALTLSLRVVPKAVGEKPAGSLTFDVLADFSDVLNIKGFLKCAELNSGYLAGLIGGAVLKNFKVVRRSALSLESNFEYADGLWFFHLENAELLMRDGSRNGLFLRGKGNQNTWKMDLFRFKWDNFDMAGYGQVGKNASGRKINGNILVGNELYTLNADWYKDGVIEVRGNRNFSLTIGDNLAGRTNFKLSVKDFSLPLPNGQFLIDLGLQGTKRGESWNISSNKVRFVYKDYLDQSEISINFVMDMTDEELAFRNILVQDRWGSIWGVGSVRNYSELDKISGTINLEGPGQENYNATVTRNGNLWNIGMDIYQARLDRIGYRDLSGNLTLKGSSTIGGNNPRLDIDLWTEEGSLNNYPLQVNASIAASSHSISVRDFDFIHPWLSLENFFLLLDVQRGRFLAKTDVGTRANNTVTSSAISLVSDFDRADNLIDFFSNKLPDFKGVIQTKPVLWNGYTHFPAFTFNFERNDDSLSIQSPAKKILDARYQFEDGRIYIKASRPLPFSVQSEGYLRDGNVDLFLREIVLDPTLINYFIPRDPELNEYYVLFREGRFRGNLHITGEGRSPEINGLIFAEQILVDTPYTYALIKPASTFIVFSGKRIDFRRINIDVGEGVVYGSGYLELENWRISDFDMIYGGENGVTGESVPAYYNFDDVRIEGSFTGEIRMKGDGREFSLDGNFLFPTIEASLGREPKKELLFVRKARRKYNSIVKLNLNLTSGNNCTFFFPSKELKIIQATAEAGQAVSVAYISNPQFFSVLGELKIKRGEIRYFDRSFQIVDGSLNLDEDFQDFNPILDLRAETRIRDDVGEDVDISLVYNAPVMSDFNPRIETNPLRTDLETATLLGQIVVPFSSDDENSQGNRSLLLATGSLFEQVGLTQPVEQALREKLNLDIVSIRTNIVGNALAEGFYNDSGANPANFVRFLDKTNFFLGKYINRSLFISGSVAADYFEGESISAPLGGLKFTPTLILEMETPILNIAWSYSPDPAENKNFVSDNKISLNRRFTF